MKKLTQAQRRAAALQNFNERYIHDIEKAKYIINSYYRLAGLNYRVCILQNDEATCNSKYLKELEAKEEKHIKRLDVILSNYGLNIAYAGIYPTIAKVDKQRGTIDHEAYFYIG